MEVSFFSINIFDILFYVVVALLIIVPTLRRIYANKHLTNTQKYIYTALTVLLPPIGLLLYYMKSQSDIKKRSQQVEQ